MFLDPATGEMVNGIKKPSYTHEALADLIIANPAIDQNDLAAHFGYSPAWLSQIISSDSWQAYLRERKAQIVDPILRGAVEESLKGLVFQSMQILREKLSANPSTETALEVFKTSTKALGYGARPTTTVNISQTNNTLVGLLSGLSEPRVVNPALSPQTMPSPA